SGYCSAATRIPPSLIPPSHWTQPSFCPYLISYNIHAFCSFIRCPVPVYVPISWVIQDNRFLFALSCRSYPPGQKCIIGKNVQNFFGDRNFCCRTHLFFRRSEEHTSELQSRFDFVCRLLLEKKKKLIQTMLFYHDSS